jgi:hypothetical protein
MCFTRSRVPRSEKSHCRIEGARAKLTFDGKDTESGCLESERVRHPCKQLHLLAMLRFRTEVHQLHVKWALKPEPLC